MLFGFLLKRFLDHSTRSFFLAPWKKTFKAISRGEALFKVVSLAGTFHCLIDIEKPPSGGHPLDRTPLYNRHFSREWMKRRSISHNKTSM